MKYNVEQFLKDLSVNPQGQSFVKFMLEKKKAVTFSAHREMADKHNKVIRSTIKNLKYFEKMGFVKINGYYYEINEEFIPINQK
jgi:hypothetical protein